MPRLKDFVYTGEFRIIDGWNHQEVEFLPRDEAIAKYGDCDVRCSYTAGTSQVPDAFGKIPSWETDVWVDIPGMRIGIWNKDNLLIPFCGTESEATFKGKATGLLITVNKYGADDYSIWWREESNRDNILAGFSVRGTAKQIIKELEGEI